MLHKLFHALWHHTVRFSWKELFTATMSTLTGWPRLSNYCQCMRTIGLITMAQKASSQAMQHPLKWQQMCSCVWEDAGGSRRLWLALALPCSGQQPISVLKTVKQYCCIAHITTAVCFPLQALGAVILLSWLQHASLTDLFSVSMTLFANASSAGFKKTGSSSSHWPWQKNWQ